MADNPLVMKCKVCGEINQLPRVHCFKCGAHLDFESAEQHIFEAAETPLKVKIQNGIKIGLAVALVLVILLMIWPGRMTRNTGEEIDARRYRLQSELLVDALNRGMPASQEISEADMNSYLDSLIAMQRESGKKSGGRLEDLGVRFFDNRAEVFVAVGRGPFTLTAQFYAKPQGDGFKITGAKAGHLPLPGVLGRLYASTQSGLFRQLKNESRIVRNMDGAVVNDGSIEVLVKGPQDD